MIGRYIWRARMAQWVR